MRIQLHGSATPTLAAIATPPLATLQPQTFEFGEFELDPAGTGLTRSGIPVAIQPKPFAMLVHLVLNRDRAVTKQELFDTIWRGVSVSDQALWSVLRDLRRAVGDTDRAARMIRTLRGNGFRFAAEITSHGAVSARRAWIVYGRRHRRDKTSRCWLQRKTGSIITRCQFGGRHRVMPGST
jgi:DNA-binding winged helix-turn-helix (wHTH) protein